MPLPRPIPTPTHSRPSPQHQHPRPGSSVPRKAHGVPLNSISTLDCRAEVALLDALPRSLPAHSSSAMEGGGTSSKGVIITDRLVKRGQEPSSGDAARAARGKEVDVQELLESSKGKRTGRVTTAQQLGFDFIPNPSIIPLPERAPRSAALASRTLSSPLSATPITPPLIPANEHAQEELQDWEHIEDDADLDDNDDGVLSPGVARPAPKTLQVEEDVEDVVILGELELEDPEDLVQVQGGGRKEGISYARAVGNTTRT